MPMRRGLRNMTNAHVHGTGPREKLASCHKFGMDTSGDIQPALGLDHGLHLLHHLHLIFQGGLQKCPVHCDHATPHPRLTRHDTGPHSSRSAIIPKPDPQKHEGKRKKWRESRTPAKTSKKHSDLSPVYRRATRQVTYTEYGRGV